MDKTVENIGSFVMIIAIFGIVAWVIISVLNFALKKRMIDLGRTDEDARKFLSNGPETTLQNLKWALLFFFGGLGLIVCGFLPWRGDESPVPYGLEAIFISVGFFIYYLLARPKNS